MNTADRFSRQTILPEFGLAGQKTLASSSVLIVGCGGLGSPIALYLAAAGVGRLGLVDGDSVDLSNLQRQIMFSENEVGKQKATAAQARVSQLNSAVKVDAFSRMYSGEWALEVSQDYDLIVDCTDNFSSKFLINDIALRLNKPFVQASVSGFEGRMASFWATKGACYRCLYPSLPEFKVQNCQESGVLGPIVGVVGSWQALECIKVLLDIHGARLLRPSYGRLMVFDFLGNSQTALTVPKREKCLCQSDPESIRVWQVASVCEVGPRVREVTWEEASSMESVAFLDVRERPEVERGMIPGARHWPLSRLEGGEMPEFLDRCQSWVIYCAGGVRSRRATSLLKVKNPHLELFSLARGIDALDMGVVCGENCVVKS